MTSPPDPGRDSFRAPPPAGTAGGPRPSGSQDDPRLPPPDASAGVPIPPGEAPDQSRRAEPSDARAPTALPHRRPLVGYALYLTASVLFGLNGTVSKILLQSVGDAARVSQLRVTAAFLLLLVVVAVTNRPTLRLRRAELGPIAAYGILGVAMTQWLYFVAIERMPIGIALLIEFTAPIMVVLWVRFGWGHPVRRTIWLGLALALLGLALVAEIWHGLQLNPVAVAAAFGAAVALAVYYLLGETAGRQRDPVSLTLWGFGFASALWAIVLPWWHFDFGALAGGAAPLGEGTPTVPLWALAAWMVVLGTIAPFWLVLAAIRHIGAAGASIVGMTEPFLAAIVAWVVLGEVLTGVQLIGGLVILTGVVIAERARS